MKTFRDQLFEELDSYRTHRQQAQRICDAEKDAYQKAWWDGQYYAYHKACETLENLIDAYDLTIHSSETKYRGE